MFPTAIVDNFYEDPDAVRKFALSQEFYPLVGNNPGKRTKELWEINPPLFDYFTKRLFSMFYDFEFVEVNWRVYVAFQLTPSLDPDPDSPKNKGWIHLDNYVMAGVLYLNPEIDKEAGTSVYKMKSPVTPTGEDVVFNFYNQGQAYTDGEICIEDFDEKITAHNSCFEETVKISNVYNRLIVIPNTAWHGVSSYYSSGEPRLTQVFYVQDLRSSSRPPLTRYAEPLLLENN